MKLEIKYGIDDEVYAVFKEQDTVQVIKGKINEFSYSTKYGLSYYIDVPRYDDFKEDEIIAVDDKEGLVKKIDELLERGE